MTAHRLDSYNSERWTCIHKFSSLLDIREIRSVKMYESYHGKVILLVNHRHIKVKDKFEMNLDDPIFKKSDVISQAMNWTEPNTLK